MKKKRLSKTVEDKTIVWFKDCNKYLILENTTAAILKRVSSCFSAKEIVVVSSKKLSVPLDKTIDFILDLKKILIDPTRSLEPENFTDYGGIDTLKLF
jgi:hypothetical protein